MGNFFGSCFDLLCAFGLGVIVGAYVAGSCAASPAPEPNAFEAETRAIVRKLEERLDSLEGAKSVLAPRAPLGKAERPAGKAEKPLGSLAD